MIKAAIAGGGGYTAGELIKLLSAHSGVDLVCIQSESQAGKYVYEAHPSLFNICKKTFAKDLIEDIDVLFLCKGHGESMKYLSTTPLANKTKIIDLSNDFRLTENSHYKSADFVYGLVELNKKEIAKANYVANPGCFATAIQLALLPLVKEKELISDIVVSAITGSTGAGQKASDTNQYSWRSNNHSSYKVMEHQHEKEIMQTIKTLDEEFTEQLVFIPQRGAFTRGIYCNVAVKTNYSIEENKIFYQEFYKESLFTSLVNFDCDVKQVVNTNNCFINLKQKNNNLIITSVIDNLLKGASGQALQNMNIMFGMDESLGLNLLPVTF